MDFDKRFCVVGVFFLKKKTGGNFLLARVKKRTFIFGGKFKTVSDTSLEKLIEIP